MTTAPTAPLGADSLRAELGSVEADYPRWQVRIVPETGCIVATYWYSRDEMRAIETAVTKGENTSGQHAVPSVSFYRKTVPGIRLIIADRQHAWEVALQNAGVAA
jgi:hypothetical protein